MITTSRPRLAAASLILGLIGFGILDALVSEQRSYSQTTTAPTIPIIEVSKRDSIDVISTLNTLKFEAIAQKEPTLLEQVAPANIALQYRTLLRAEERLAHITWLDHANAKNTFQALKQALLQSFSDNVKDLKDETLSKPGKPTVNILRFTDTHLSPDHLIFVRIRERLYELHLPLTHQTALDELMIAITERDT